MNVRITHSLAPGRTTLFAGVANVTCDGKDYPGSGARRWLQLDADVSLPIGGRHGGIEIAIDDEGGCIE